MKMMDLPELIILDVGHGNSAVLRDGASVVVIDCAPGSTLLDTLIQLEIDEIQHIIISHADYDHLGGLMALLTSTEVKIHNVYLNPDPSKNTSIWTDIRCAVKDARERSTVRFSLNVTTELSKELSLRQVEVQVLAPTPELAMSGVAGTDLKGRRLVSNSMSAVIGIVHNSHRIAILPGDIDQIGLDTLLENHNDLTADILVFPHHGGKPGNTDGQEFARQLCSRVKPRLIVFSLARDRFGNPHEEVVRGVKHAVADAHIMCTQLSEKCAAQLPEDDASHLTALPARGNSSRSCCGGTILVTITENGTNYSPERQLHRGFIDSARLPSPICLVMKSET